MAYSLWGLVKGLLIQDETDRTKEISLEVDPASTASTRTTLKSVQTANRTVTLPDATDILLGRDTTDVVTNKSIDADTNTLTNIENDNIKAGAAIDASKIANGSVDNTEFQALNGVTGNIQTALNTLQTDISNHITDTSDAHDASAISVIPSGNLVSTDVQAALVELQGEIDILAPGGGANLTLSNLTSPTAVNQDLLPDTTDTRNIGNSPINRFNNIFASTITVGNELQAGDDHGEGILLGAAASGETSLYSPSGQITAYATSAPIRNVGLFTRNNNSGLATDSGSLFLETGNKTVGVGNSGNIQLRTGTATGTRGKIILQDGSHGTVGHVLTSTDVNGSASWQALPVTSVVGVSRVIGGSGDTTSSTAYTMNARKLVLANSLNEIVVVTPGGGVTNSTTTAGPAVNGRDQVGAFPNSSWIHFYWIWNGTTLATLSSLSSTTPTLPSGYTHFAYMAAIYKDSGGNFLTMRQRGSWMHYKTRKLITNINAAPIGNIYYIGVVPPNASVFQMQYNGRITSTAGGLIDITFFVRAPNTGTGDILYSEYKSMTGLGASQTQEVLSGTANLPVLTDIFNNNEFVHELNIVNGTSPLISVYAAGFQIPNGDN